MSTTSKLGADMTDDTIDAVSKALRRAWQLGQTYWQQADSDSYKQQDKSDETQKMFEALVDETRALLARQPAAIDKQEAKLCTICNGYGRYQDGDSGTESDGYAPNIVECDCAPEERHPAAPSVKQDESPRAATVNLYICENCDAVWKRNYLHLPEGCSSDDWMAVPKKRGSQSLSTLIQVASLACIENRLLDDEDRRELAEYADVIRNSPQIERAASTSTNVAQGAEPSAYRTLLDSLGYPWLPCPICNGTEGCDHSYPERARAALAAPPAQTAITGRVLTYRNQPDNVGAWQLGEACRRAAELPAGDYIDRGLGLLKELQAKGYGVIALTAAQSASGDTK